MLKFPEHHEIIRLTHNKPVVPVRKHPFHMCCKVCFLLHQSITVYIQAEELLSHSNYFNIHFLEVFNIFFFDQLHYTV